MDFQELFIWLAQEHEFLRLVGIPGGSQELLGRPWRLLAAPGGNPWKTLFIGQNIYVSFPKAIPNNSHDLYFGALRIHEASVYIAKS